MSRWINTLFWRGYSVILPFHTLQRSQREVYNSSQSLQQQPGPGKETLLVRSGAMSSRPSAKDVMNHKIPLREVHMQTCHWRDACLERNRNWWKVYLVLVPWQLRTWERSPKWRTFSLSACLNVSARYRRITGKVISNKIQFGSDTHYLFTSKYLIWILCSWWKPSQFDQIKPSGYTNYYCFF